MARHHYNISSKGAVLPWRNDAEMGPANSLHASANYIERNERYDFGVFHHTWFWNLSLYSLYCAEACHELAGPISALLRPGNPAPFEEISQRWRGLKKYRPICNTVSHLTGPQFKLQTSRSRDERATARPTGWLRLFLCLINLCSLFYEVNLFFFQRACWFVISKCFATLVKT